jgi:hypothetical protein
VLTLVVLTLAWLMFAVAHRLLAASIMSDVTPRLFCKRTKPLWELTPGEFQDGAKEAHTHCYREHSM